MHTPYIILKYMVHHKIGIIRNRLFTYYVSNAIMKRKNNDIFMEHQLPNAGDLDPIADLQTQVIPITTPKYLEPDTSL